MDYLKSYRNVFDQNIILLFKGELTFDLVTSLIATLKERLEINEDDIKIKNRFYNVATECIQNLYYYLEELDGKPKLSTYDSRSALIMIAGRKRFYSIMTGNYLPVKKSAEISKVLDEINQIPPEKLREHYNSILKEEEFTRKGIGGLGFIDIARKTGGEKLRYRLQSVNDHVDYFTLQIRLPRDL